jgi:predicted nucleic acid-binding Zn ribbon protein
MSKRDLALDLFRTYKTGFIKKPKPREIPRTGTGDPELLSGILDNLVEDRGWDSGLAEGNLFAQWEEIVGDEVATHAQPISLLDGRLLIQTSSTAWATQLTLVQDQILAKIRASAPGATVDSLSITGPKPPSWKRGLRSISNGRGPRDTYG